MYEGNFENGLFHGSGALYSENEKIIYDGNFNKGKYEGKGTVYSPPGIKHYTGFFKNGLKSGEGGKEFHPNGRDKYVGKFADNFIISGKEYPMKSMIPIYEGGFKNNKYHGEGQLFDYRGLPEYKGRFLDGHKYATYYHSNGKKKFEGCIIDQKA
jgi:hypothetical protein